jgi:hypothetical protein
VEMRAGPVRVDLEWQSDHSIQPDQLQQPWLTLQPVGVVAVETACMGSAYQPCTPAAAESSFAGDVEDVAHRHGCNLERVELVRIVDRIAAAFVAEWAPGHARGGIVRTVRSRSWLSTRCLGRWLVCWLETRQWKDHSRRAAQVRLGRVQGRADSRCVVSGHA